MNINELRKKLNKKDLILSLFITVIFAIGLSLLSFIADTHIIIITAFSVIAFITVAFIKHTGSEILKRVGDSESKTYSKIQAYISLQDRLKLRKALFPMQGSAITPDLGNILVDYAKKMQADVIVECGSGVSTIIWAYCLEKNQKGIIKSLDHEKKYLEITKNAINEHGLSKFVDFIYAPIEEYEINKQSHKFYDISGLENISEIDILFVDGPPRTIKKDIRFASVPLLISKVKKGGIIILDDADRKSESKAVKKWLREYPFLRYEYIPTIKGTVILTK